jgi:hypothetical protein
MAKCRLTARTATHANRPQCKAVHSSAESPRKRSIGYVGLPTPAGEQCRPVRLRPSLRPIMTRFEREPSVFEYQSRGDAS